MAGPDVICVGSSPEAKDTLKRIEREATFRYQTLTVPDAYAANVVFANGFLLHRSGEEYPESAKIFEEKLSHWTVKPMDFSEMEKADGCLTCCSILIRKTRHLKNIMGKNLAECNALQQHCIPARFYYLVKKKKQLLDSNVGACHHSGGHL